MSGSKGSYLVSLDDETLKNVSNFFRINFKKEFDDNFSKYPNLMLIYQ